MKTLGIDYGTRRIGLALSDENGRIAFPHSVLENNSNLIQTITQLRDTEGFTTIVLGDPGENDLKEAVAKFHKMLSDQGFVVHLEKEFMTSMHVSQASGTKPIAQQTKQKREMKKDESAAALILQRFLDKKNN